MRGISDWSRYARRKKTGIAFLISILLLIVVMNFEVQQNVADEGDKSVTPEQSYLWTDPLESELMKANESLNNVDLLMRKNIFELARLKAYIGFSNYFHGRDFTPNTKISKRNWKDSLKETKKSPKIQDKCQYAIDRPNWTIFYKHNVSKFCPKAKLQKWVKRIVFANGTIVYKGCTQHTRKCGMSPYFDRKHNMRINTRPCCLKNIISIFRDITKGLSSYGADHFLHGGGLIGWYRNRSVVPYDHDLDVIVSLAFWQSPKFKTFLHDLEKKHGYFVKKMSWNKLKVYYSRKNHNFVDMWPYGVNHNRFVRIKSSQWKFQSISNILPLRTDFFEGFQIQIPNKPEVVLDIEYGKGKWKQELTCKRKGKFGNCVT